MKLGSIKHYMVQCSILFNRFGLYGAESTTIPESVPFVTLSLNMKE